MNKNVLYGLVFIVLFCALILPDSITPSKGIIFTLEEWVSLILFFLGVVFFRNSIAKIIEKLNQKYPWRLAFKQRLLIQSGLLLLGTAIISTVLFLPAAYYLDNYGIPEFYQEIIDKKNELNLRDYNPKFGNKSVITELKLSKVLTTLAKVSFFYLLLILVIEEIYSYSIFQSRKKMEIENHS